MAMQDSKGGSNLAQAFLQNTAAQAPALPQIERPNTRFVAPQIQPSPQVQQPVAVQPETRKEWYNTMTGEAMPNYRPRPWMSSMNDMGINPAQREVTVMPQQTLAPAPSPSQAQLLARAINERAMARSGGK